MNIPLLISSYVDGELNDGEVAQLVAVLANDVAAADLLVFNSFIHAQLLSWLNQEGEDAGEPTAPRLSLTSVVKGTTFSNTTQPSSLRTAPSQTGYDAIGPLRRRITQLAALAASLLILVTLVVSAYRFVAGPELVGQLTEAKSCRWSAATAKLGVGTFLPAGQELTLVEGSAVITLSSGAKLYIEGPTSIHIQSAMIVKLIDGKVAAKVPRQAIGFTVSSTLAKFVDLGTAFTLSMKEDRSFQLHVFEGLIELQLDPRFGKAANQPVRVAEVHAVNFDIAAGDIAPLHFQEGKKMPF